MTAIVSLPLTNQLTNGTTNDASQVMADLNQIANNVNSYAAPLDSPTFINTPRAPTQASGDSTTLLATTAFVIGQAGTALPTMDGAAAVGSSNLYAHQDHVHPSDTSRQAALGYAPVNRAGDLVSGTLTVAIDGQVGYTTAALRAVTASPSAGNAIVSLTTSGDEGVSITKVRGAIGLSIFNGSNALDPLSVAQASLSTHALTLGQANSLYVTPAQIIASGSIGSYAISSNYSGAPGLSGTWQSRGYAYDYGSGTDGNPYTEHTLFQRIA
ncbi:hypothetical protein [Glaciimonas immobilis]|uniref:Uncharacterized protein n=1 Tax=Glaciimonas immobilis TaxID=728004 RepID=A0A840RUM2_9BURK|nr:hypothetical protein [Glaciimonas immobilis]KAF3997351.1 hypothetical protein HAV38_12825 [Glaciimonas immobilis]MBB5200758.1 hypothetical protein [Glaciimonas immobilis]